MLGRCLQSRGNWGDVSHGFGNADMYEFCDQGWSPKLCVRGRWVGVGVGEGLGVTGWAWFG